MHAALPSTIPHACPSALQSVFTSVRAEVVSFDNPILERKSSSTVYLATKSQP